MGQVLTAPISSKNLERHGNGHLRVGSCEMQGFRVNMEDAHTIQLSLSEKHPQSSFFSVFDGHGGDKASLFLAEKLMGEIAKLDKPSGKETIMKCFQDLDTLFLQKPEADRENGSTAVFALVEPKTKDKDVKSWIVTVANLGDSRAIVIRKDGKCEALTKDHKPENPDEEKRIQAAGGFVRANRVDGQLAMSRAIGDSKYKENSSLPPDKQKVIAVPDVETCEIQKGDRLLLYCDGVVEQMTNEDVAAFVHKELKESKEEKPDPAAILSKLLDYSLEKGSKDNMSALMVMFEDGSDYERKSEFIAGPFTPYKSDESFRNAYIADAKKYGYEGDALMTLAKKAEENMPKDKAAPAGTLEGSNVMLKSLIQSLASNLGGIPGENREEKAMALMAILQGGGSYSSNSEEEDDQPMSPISPNPTTGGGSSLMSDSPAVTSHTLDDRDEQPSTTTKRGGRSSDDQR